MNRRRRSLVLSASIGAVGLFAGCAAENTTDAPASTDGVDSTTVGMMTSPPPVSSPASSSVLSSPPAVTAAAEGSTPVTTEGIDPGLKPYIDIAVADLAKRVSVDAASVVVISVTLVSWPDSALGCPQPGQQYAQVTTDGSVILLKVGDKLYRYHSGGSRKPFLCEQF